MIKKLHLANIFIVLTLAACQGQTPLKETMKLPKSMKENSALEMTAAPALYWTILDSGNPAELYGIGQDGTLVKTVSIDARNMDWEELSSDDEGNLYIGDIGNNNNKRRTLYIYKIAHSDLDRNDAKPVMKTEFYYPEQKDFPPQKSDKYYDGEAFFYHKGNFYIFTKNRSSNAGFTYVYVVPAQDGKFAARRAGQIKTCDSFSQCAITAADISPDGSKVALLSGGYVWLVTGFSGDDYSKGSVRKIDLATVTQKEGLCFSDDNHIMISDERAKGEGGKVYELNIAD